MNITPVSFSSLNCTTKVQECPEPKPEVKTTQPQPKTDTVSFSGRSEEMSDEEKKELVANARTKAAGYAAFGGIFSSLYYGLRSDKKVAKKFNLDPVEDKDLVKKIKNEQLKWTIPAAVIDIALFVKGKGTKLIPSLIGSLIAAIPYFYSKTESGKKVEL